MLDDKRLRSLSIIIPNYNGADLLRKFLPSVLSAVQQYQGNCEIIIVDDGSKDESRNVLAEFSSQYPNQKIKAYFNTQNLGFAGTCNVGISHANGEILFFLNNDVELEEYYFNFFNDYFAQNHTFAVTTCGFTYEGRKDLDGIKTGRWKRGLSRVTGNIYNREIESKHLTRPYLSFSVQGAYFFADAKKVKELGGFDPLLSPYIYEETDLAYRALKRGWRIYYEPRCIGYHAVSSTLNKTPSFQKKVISHKNRMIFIWKNIHSRKLLLSHFFFLFIKLGCFNKAYWKAFRICLSNLDEIKAKRKVEKGVSVVRDTQLFFNFPNCFK
ncbi:MAG TPA: glycosyltransferase [Cytophagaceae bacterium]